MTRARELADLLTGGQTITTTDNSAQLTLESTDADAAVGPLLDMIRDSASPADSDTLGRIRFRGDNDAGEAFTYGTITSKITDASDSTEGGLLTFLVGRNGSVTSALDLNETETVFNEGSLDADFRVEGNGNANALFVQGSDDFIGIGTGTPKKKLHIQDTTSDGIIILDRNGTSADHQICFAHNYQSGGQSGGNYYAIGVDDSENKLVFAFDANSQASLSADAKMVLNSSGNIGIHTASPTQLLSVGGDSSGTKVIQVTNSTAGTAFNNGMQMFISDSGGGFNMRENYPLQFFVNGSERMRIDASARVLIGSTSNNAVGTSAKFQVGYSKTGEFGILVRPTDNNTGGGEPVLFQNFAGNTIGTISASSSNVAFNTSSDYRLKDGIVDMTGAIDRVKALSPKRFHFIENPDKTVDGFLAHEAQAVVSEAVTGIKDETRKVTNVVLSSDGKLLAQDVLQADWTAGKLETTDDDGNAVDALYPSNSTWSASHDEPVMQGIDQSKLVPLLTGALQEAIAKIETLETKVAKLEAGE